MGFLRYVIIQLDAAGMGVVLYAIISSIDVEFFSEHRYYMVLFNMFLLLLLIPFGTDNGTGNKSTIALKLRLAFPPYSALRNSEYIKFLNGRPWLLPAAWVYRFFHNIKNNPAHMMETVKNTGDEKTTALARQEYKFFEEIGLI